MIDFAEILNANLQIVFFLCKHFYLHYQLFENHTRQLLKQII